MVIFEVGEEYANRKGSYTVLELNDPKMLVEYGDGSIADLSIPIQQRIWENIVTEREAERARTVKSRKKRVSTSTRFYIKPTSMLTVEELSTTNKQEGIPASGRWLATLRRGDRLIYYAKENQLFFAVVTITGPGKKPKGRGRKKTSVLYFPVDVDAYVVDLSKALLAVSVELESQPKYKEILADSDDYLEITEDEFELLAEMLTEVSEEDEEDETDQEKDDDEFDA
jgi:hypothetical protein